MVNVVSERLAKDGVDVNIVFPEGTTVKRTNDYIWVAREDKETV